jgi:hypothetical protein
MVSDILVAAAAVEAVEDGVPLRWSRSFRFFGSTWNDYRRAAAWVSREQKKRSVLTAGNLSPISTQSSYLRTTKQSSSSKAVKALLEADAVREAKKAEEDRLQKDSIARLSVYAGSKPLEHKADDWIKENALQLVGLIMIIPLGILCGFNYGGGLIARIIAPIAFILGILILVFRYVRAMATAIKSDKPIRKDWYK